MVVYACVWLSMSVYELCSTFLRSLHDLCMMCVWCLEDCARSFSMCLHCVLYECVRFVLDLSTT